MLMLVISIRSLSLTKTTMSTSTLFSHPRMTTQNLWGMLIPKTLPLTMVNWFLTQFPRRG